VWVYNITPHDHFNFEQIVERVPIDNLRALTLEPIEVLRAEVEKVGTNAVFLVELSG